MKAHLPSAWRGSSWDAQTLAGSSLELHLLTLEGAGGFWAPGAVTPWWSSCCVQSRKTFHFQPEHLYLPCFFPALGSTRGSALARHDEFCWFLRQPSPALPSGHIAGDQTHTQTPPACPGVSNRNPWSTVQIDTHLCHLSRTLHTCATAS